MVGIHGTGWVYVCVCIVYRENEWKWQRMVDSGWKCVANLHHLWLGIGIRIMVSVNGEIVED